MMVSVRGSRSVAVADVVIAVIAVIARVDTEDVMPERARRVRHQESSLLNCTFHRPLLLTEKNKLTALPAVVDSGVVLAVVLLLPLNLSK